MTAGRVGDNEEGVGHVKGGRGWRVMSDEGKGTHSTFCETKLQSAF